MGESKLRKARRTGEERATNVRFRKGARRVLIRLADGGALTPGPAAAEGDLIHGTCESLRS